MPSMKMPDAVAGVGAKVTLVLLDRIVEAEVVEAHVNAKISSLNGEMAFVDDSVLVKFKLLKTQKLDPQKLGEVAAAIQRAITDRGKRDVEI